MRNITEYITLSPNWCILSLQTFSATVSL